MVDKLLKPYNRLQRAKFLANYVYPNKLKFIETETALYAIQPWQKVVNDEVIDNTKEYEAQQAQEREKEFNKEFFLTSLGYIRRKVNMATGDTKDFLSDLLPTISMAVQTGQEVPIITYKKPDFTKEFSIEYMESLQEIKTVTLAFIQECALQVSKDFMPVPLNIK